MKFIKKWLEPTIVVAHMFALVVSLGLVIVVDILTFSLFNLTNRYRLVSEPLLEELGKRAKNWERKYKN